MYFSQAVGALHSCLVQLGWGVRCLLQCLGLAVEAGHGASLACSPHTANVEGRGGESTPPVWQELGYCCFTPAGQEPVSGLLVAMLTLCPTACLQSGHWKMA